MSESRVRHRLAFGAALLLAAVVLASCGDDADDADPVADDADTGTVDTDDAEADAGDTGDVEDADDATSDDIATDAAMTDDVTQDAPVGVPELPVVPATVEGPITGGAGPVVPQPASPLPEGYVEEEFFIAGAASRFEAAGDLTADGMWSAVPAGTDDYRTRVLVRRPPAAEFSGTVVVEWLNVSAIESSPDWGYLSEEIGRGGHAYVAASIQSLGVLGGESLLQVEVDADAAAEQGADAGEVDGSGLVNIDPERYGSLVHPGDAYTFDMYTQIGAALAANTGGLLGDLEPTQVLAAGESQSAGFLTTYINAVHLLAPTYDGFFVHSRGAGGAPLGGEFGADEGESFTDRDHQIRADVDEPVFIVQAETDLTLLGYRNARQPDSDTIRTWEMAGTAHADAHVVRSIVGGGRDPGAGSFIGCTAPINAGPHHEIASAALAHLVDWVAGGEAPPMGERLELDGDEIARDDLGRAIGGIRNPLVDVPIAIYTGDPAPGLSTGETEGFDVCALFGQTFTLDQAALVELHGDADAYVAAFEAATVAAVDAGVLLPADADQLREEAQTNRLLFP